MNTLYPSAALLLLTGGLDFTAGAWTVLAVDDTFAYSSAHDFLDDVPGGVRLGSAVLTGRVVETTLGGTSGVCDADDVLIPTTGGDTLGALLLYVDSGVEATSPLVAMLTDNEDGTPIRGTTTVDGIVIPWSARGLLVIGTA